MQKLRISKGAAKEQSPWWIFVYSWHTLIDRWILDFTKGNYKFAPMLTYNIENEAVIVWDYRDRLVIKWIHKIISPIFKHIISPLCFHLHGPSGVKIAITRIKQALEHKSFRYFIRADIKSYYASIDRNILVKQINQHFNDPRLLKYLADIVNIPVISAANVFTPDKGIPRRSSLSPFFGALYLSPLDQAFEKITGVCYFRFMDDSAPRTRNKRLQIIAEKVA